MKLTLLIPINSLTTTVTSESYEFVSLDSITIATFRGMFDW